MQTMDRALRSPEAQTISPSAIQAPTLGSDIAAEHIESRGTLNSLFSGMAPSEVAGTLARYAPDLTPGDREKLFEAIMQGRIAANREEIGQKVEDATSRATLVHSSGKDVVESDRHLREIERLGGGLEESRGANEEGKILSDIEDRVTEAKGARRFDHNSGDGSRESSDIQPEDLLRSTKELLSQDPSKFTEILFNASDELTPGGQKVLSSFVRALDRARTESLMDDFLGPK
jgi:hypothetical protein